MRERGGVVQSNAIKVVELSSLILVILNLNLYSFYFIQETLASNGAQSSLTGLLAVKKQILSSCLRKTLFQLANPGREASTKICST